MRNKPLTASLKITDNIMNYITLSELKQHLNVDEWYTDTDEYIVSLGDVAEQVVARHLDRPLSEVEDPETHALPMPIIHAIKLLVGNYYRTREGEQYTMIMENPKGIDYLLASYKQYDNSKI